MTVFSNVNNYIILFIINWEVQSSVIIFFFPYTVMLVSTLHVHVSRFFFVFFFFVYLLCFTVLLADYQILIDVFSYLRQIIRRKKKNKGHICRFCLLQYDF